MHDFFLTKTSHLRQITVKILKQKIPNLGPDTTQRQTRRMSHNPGEVGLQLDEDNALVSSDDRIRPHIPLLLHRMGLRMIA